MRHACRAVGLIRVSVNIQTAIFKSVKIPKLSKFIGQENSGCKYTTSVWTLTETLPGGLIELDVSEERKGKQWARFH